MASEERRQKLLALHTLEPDDAFVMYSLGMECAGLGRTGEALDWYDRATASDPKNCYSYYHKAKALLDLERHSEAAATIELGILRAREVGDMKAHNELSSLRDEFEISPS